MQDYGEIGVVVNRVGEGVMTVEGGGYEYGLCV